MQKNRTKNPKEITIYVRVDPELKAHIEKTAKRIGLSVSAYARMVLIGESGFDPEAGS